MIELIVQPASTSVESGLDLFEALSGYVSCLRYIRLEYLHYCRGNFR